MHRLTPPNTPTPVLVSRCLLGVACRYHGRPVRYHSRIRKLAESGRYRLIAVCPEVDGGLPVPRPPTRRVEGRLICDGRDVTEFFQRGAEIALEAAVRERAFKAYLLRKSPSCDKLVGLAALYLQKHGIYVVAV